MWQSRKLIWDTLPELPPGAGDVLEDFSVSEQRSSRPDRTFLKKQSEASSLTLGAVLREATVYLTSFTIGGWRSWLASSVRA